jgi:hypothetical protein
VRPLAALHPERRAPRERTSRSRSARTGLFTFGGRIPTLLDQWAMVQVYAELAAC